MNPKHWADKYPELLAEAGDKIARWLMQDGICSDRAWEIASRVTDAMMKDWAGQQLYIPTGCRMESAARAAEIRGRFRGNNHRALAVEFGLTETRIRQIVSRKGERIS